MKSSHLDSFLKIEPKINLIEGLVDRAVNFSAFSRASITELVL